MPGASLTYTCWVYEPIIFLPAYARLTIVLSPLLLKTISPVLTPFTAGTLTSGPPSTAYQNAVTSDDAERSVMWLGRPSPATSISPIPTPFAGGTLTSVPPSTAYPNAVTSAAEERSVMRLGRPTPATSISPNGAVLRT